MKKYHSVLKNSTGWYFFAGNRSVSKPQTSLTPAREGSAIRE